MSRETDDRILDDLRDALKHIRAILDELAKSDARNTAEIRTLFRLHDRLEELMGKVEKRLEKRLADLSDDQAQKLREISEYLQKVDVKASGNEQERWKLAGGRTTLLKLVTVLSLIVGTAAGALKLAGVI